MSGDDRSWSLAPVFLWFSAALIIALCLFDGGLGALADRFRPWRDPAPAPAAGPTFTAPPVVIAEAPDTIANAPGPRPGTDPTTRPAGGGHDRAKILSLEDDCLDGTPEPCRRWAM